MIYAYWKHSSSQIFILIVPSTVRRYTHAHIYYIPSRYRYFHRSWPRFGPRCSRLVRLRMSVIKPFVSNFSLKFWPRFLTTTYIYRGDFGYSTSLAVLVSFFERAKTIILQLSRRTSSTILSLGYVDISLPRPNQQLTTVYVPKSLIRTYIIRIFFTPLTLGSRHVYIYTTNAVDDDDRSAAVFNATVYLLYIVTCNSVGGWKEVYSMMLKHSPRPYSCKNYSIIHFRSPQNMSSPSYGSIGIGRFLYWYTYHIILPDTKIDGRAMDIVYDPPTAGGCICTSK